MDTGRTGQWSSAEIETSNGQVILVADDSCYLNENSFACPTFTRFHFKLTIKLITGISQENGRRRVTVASLRIIYAVVVNSTLTGVDAGIAPCPEIPGNSVPVVPPAKGDASELEWCVIAIVLIG